MRTIFLFAAAVVAACSPPPSPAVVPPATSPPAPAVSAPAPQGRPITVCILRDGQAVNVQATLLAESGDTVVDGRRFSEVYPAASPPYAEGIGWYVANEPIHFRGRAMMKHGLTRVLPRELIHPIQQYRGLPLFAEVGTDSTSASVVYLFVRPGCEFQAYQVDYVAGAVRGK